MIGMSVPQRSGTSLALSIHPIKAAKIHGDTNDDPADQRHAMT
jgi:hypothetical protein